MLIPPETLIVDVKPLSQEAKDEILARQLAETAEASGNSIANGILLKQVVAADNSCLFTSIGYLVMGKVDTTIGPHLREIIAQTVHNEKETYSDAILGRPNADYVAWIMQESSWGGAIEVSILSAYYGIE